MKTANLIKKTLIILILLFTVISCKNFMNSGDFLTSLEENIKIINAPKFTVLFEMDNNGYGTLNYIGYTECYIGQTLEVKFAENQTYKLDHWYFSNQEQITVETNEDDVTKIKIKFNENAQDLIIKPICVLRNDAISPVFNSFVVKQPDSKEIVGDNKDKFINLNPIENWSDSNKDFENNHVSSLNFEFEIYEESASVKDNLQLVVKEHLIEDIYGNALDDEFTKTITLKYKNCVKDSRYPNKYKYEGNYQFGLEYDGVVKVDVSCIDAAGNESSVKSFFIIKDTITDLFDFDISYSDSGFYPSVSTLEELDEFITRRNLVYIPKFSLKDKWYKNKSDVIDFNKITIRVWENYNKNQTNNSSKLYPQSQYKYANEDKDIVTENDDWEYLVLDFSNYYKSDIAISAESSDYAGNTVTYIKPIDYCSPQIINATKNDNMDILFISHTPLNEKIPSNSEDFYLLFLGYKIKNGIKTVISSCYNTDTDTADIKYEDNAEYHLYVFQQTSGGEIAGLVSNEKVISSSNIKTDNSITKYSSISKTDIKKSENYKGVNLFGNSINYTVDYWNANKNTPCSIKLSYTKNLTSLSNSNVDSLPYIIIKYNKLGTNGDTLSIPCDDLYENNYSIYVQTNCDAENYPFNNSYKQYIIPFRKLNFNKIYVTFDASSSSTKVEFAELKNTDISLPGNGKQAYQYYDSTDNTWYNYVSNPPTGYFCSTVKYYSNQNANEIGFTPYKTAPVYYFNSSFNNPCTLHSLTDNGDYVTIASNTPVFVHTIYSPRNFKDDPDQWEFYAATEHKVNEKIISAGSPFNMSDYNIDTSIMDADPMYDHYYYVVVAHFSDGKSLMSEVKYK